MSRTLTAVAVCLAAVVICAPGSAAAPIPSLPAGPEFLGAPAIAAPITGVAPVPRNPHLAANGDSGIHNDGWMSDTYTRPGPLGNATRVDSLLLGSECGSVAFDRAGRIVTTCLGAAPGLYLIDPAAMTVLGRYPLPGREPGEFLKPDGFSNFGGGGYFYLDGQDRAVVGGSDGHLRIFAETPAADGFTLVGDHDLTGVLQPGETLNSALPDSDGLIWFVAKTNGVVGTLDPESGVAEVIRLGSGTEGQIENSFAVGSSGDVYVATNREMLRLDAGHDGAPSVTWRVTYANSGVRKPGQVDDGTGTTPTVLPGGYVAITDNADPMNVVVYRTAPEVARREVCAVPVFARGASATENSLIGAGNALIVENNYGYTGPRSTLLGATTTPGFARVDIDPDGAGCTRVWAEDTEAAPSVVPKLSLATGLIYTFTKGAEPTDPWYWTALDFRTGALVWKRLAGAGFGFNNNYAGIALGPDGAAYLGSLGGLMSLRDGR
ncbi:NHL repeat-containing protein [Nocardia bovistercoris]|uniref:Uncharacterized protein n=1 Tax=Nocardia bovistercoris TaxID=2785916 RepID=A0A931IDW8_9NOCA|nr:hypothetical protein [Nocardia bovistercoris]MBH0778605.1 hypothetical protein [Nocardia bovistercoris]